MNNNNLSRNERLILKYMPHKFTRWDVQKKLFMEQVNAYKYLTKLVNKKLIKKEWINGHNLYTKVI